MKYNKGQQLTVGRLKEYLANIPDDVKICVGIGDQSAPAHYLLNRDGELELHPNCYMQDADITNLKTILSFIPQDKRIIIIKNRSHY